MNEQNVKIFAEISIASRVGKASSGSHSTFFDNSQNVAYHG